MARAPRALCYPSIGRCSAPVFSPSSLELLRMIPVSLFSLRLTWIFCTGCLYLPYNSDTHFSSLVSFIYSHLLIELSRTYCYSQSFLQQSGSSRSLGGMAPRKPSSKKPRAAQMIGTEGRGIQKRKKTIKEDGCLGRGRKNTWSLPWLKRLVVLRLCGLRFSEIFDILSILSGNSTPRV